VASTRERIIEAALTLIAERGLSQVTMLEIARTADIARQTLYNHYPDIPSILTEALTRHNAAAIDHLDQALSVVDTPSDTIRQLVRHIAAMSTHAGHTLESHLALPADLQEHLNGFSDAIERHIRVALTGGIDRGEFRPDLNIGIDSVLVRHALDGVSTLVAATPDDAPRIVADASRTLLAALRSENRP
jgi:AcrR family transcriptional regulator